MGKDKNENKEKPNKKKMRKCWCENSREKEKRDYFL